MVHILREMLDWTTTPGYGIREVLKFLCDTCGYQNKRILDTCIHEVNPKKLHYYNKLLHMPLYCIFFMCIIQIMTTGSSEVMKQTKDIQISSGYVLYKLFKNICLNIVYI